MRFLLGAGLIATTASCASIIGLSDYDVVDDASVSDAATREDAPITQMPVVDATPDVTIVDANTCACAAPTGWTPVLYSDDRSAACPAGLVSVDLFADPVPSAKTCTCAACKQTLPSCYTGTYTTNRDVNCAVATGITHAASTNCVQDSGTLPLLTQLVPPAPSGAASCTADGAVDASEVTTRSARMCTGSSCPCQVPDAGTFTACVEASGDLACPAGFPTKHRTGSSVTTSCGACVCAMDDVKCSGAVTFYNDNSCVVPRAATNEKQCSATIGGNYSSIKWVGTAVATCVTAPATPTVTLASASTVCCR